MLSKTASRFHIQVPFDFRTIVFSFFMGSVFSIPIGIAWAFIRPSAFDPPEWTDAAYFITVLLCLFLLPFWSHFGFPNHRVLRRIGMATFVIFFLLLLVALFFPALKTQRVY
jgi:hypothetical protein